ncbi:ATP-binding cassette domain-containing protein [Rhodococcus sp. IEGM 1379]|uniref:ATP-binding cassette domain-containing protein n=1 Tax=Rhodococcus sp. IEGM 1379 TaxID=3047086 RepID=UPI0024B76BB9|nr:ATP-binding cassette domain-containing protein [Rhodococcus sp. IEGM 1379]MDI9917565.1 ATP-binding cassette domain-containing protein [Rhodococcus sp. IEGM 1379]
MTGAIVAEGLVKTYGTLTALDGIDLEVAEGSVMALLGPNGAGKTTVVRIFTTLLIPDGGRAQVAGLDVVKDARALRSKIGASGQYAAVDEYLTGYENLDMVGRLYHLGTKNSKARARELLEQFDLVEAGDRPVKGYSGGMRRRLDLAGALVARPQVLFLDEPTTGLDPRARLGLWDVIEELVAQGTTLLLTTQYMEEAERLADQIAVIDRGSVIARGTADQLKARVGGERIELSVHESEHLDIVRQELNSLSVGEIRVQENVRRITIPVADGTDALITALNLLSARGITVFDVGLRRPTLDDVFLTLTGHQAELEDQK